MALNLSTRLPLSILSAIFRSMLIGTTFRVTLRLKGDAALPSIQQSLGTSFKENYCQKPLTRKEDNYFTLGTNWLAR